MEGLDRIVKEHPFFAAFEPAHIQLLAGCARNHRFAAGEYLFREGDPADEFFLIRQGKVALEIAAPGKPPIVFETLGDGEVAGLHGSCRPTAGCSTRAPKPLHGRLAWTPSAFAANAIPIII